jgi:tetratricopeptide (TPR) repeat protein
MPESAFSRFWNEVILPPVDKRPVPPKVTALKQRQRRLVMTTLAAVAALAAGGGVFFYISYAPQRAEKEFLEGMKLMSPGKYPDAIVHFTRALEIHSQLPDAYIERGSAHRILGETDAALADFQAAVDLNPTLADAHNGLAMIYLDRRDQSHALEELNKSIGLHPTVDALFQRGQILDAQGNHQKAINDFDRAIEENRDAPYMYRARALAKANLGDPEGAHADRLLAAELERH